MESPHGNRLRQPILALAAILALATVTRLHRLDGPMADNLQAKQVYIANKARSIARPPFNPLRNTLDFLDDRGGRIVLTEEVPLYTGLLAAGYRLFGERDAVGHLLSLVGSLVAIAAFFDLARREHGDRVGTVATVLLASSPLFIFYGRAVLPDPWMLAGMLTCAACYRRHLDGGGRGWLVASALAGIAAGSFKYFGLMVLLPLADMTRRARGWRAVLGVRFVSLAAAIVLPIALWMGLVFTRTPNPVASGWTGGDVVMPYLIVQAPGVLLDRGFYAAFFSRFLVRDCGPIAMGLIAVGLWASASRRLRPGPVGAWTAMGLLFYLLLGPKLLDHDYYELMMLPAASLWAAHGWSALSAGWLWSRLRDHGRGEPRRGLEDETTATRKSLRPILAAGLLAAAVVVQSPWILGGMFRVEGEKIALAEALRRACPSSDRVLVIGPGIALATVVHYADREGWAVRGRDLPADWPSRLAEFRARGASCVGLYFDPKASAAVRAAYQPLIESLPVVARGDGPPTGRGTRAAYVVLRLGDADAARLAAWPREGASRR